MKVTMVRSFKDHGECELFTIKFYIFDHLFDDLERFRSIQLLDAAPYEHLIVTLNRAYRKSSETRATTMRGGLCIGTRCIRAENENERWSQNKLVPGEGKVVAVLGRGWLFPSKALNADRLGTNCSG